MEDLIVEKECIKDNMNAAASFYKDELAAVTYKIKMSDRKGVGKYFTLAFSVYNFQHLIGFHKLPSFNASSSKACLKKLLKSEIEEKEIEEVLDNNNVRDRIEYIHFIKDMLSVGSEIRKSGNGTFGVNIAADYVLTKKTEGNRFAHLFLKETQCGVLEPVSFIVHGNNKYIKGCVDCRKILSVEELPVNNDNKDKTDDKYGEKSRRR